MKLDILVITVHPDDAELGCAGTIIQSKREGKKVGIVDLTRGELGTRGTAETRKHEAEAAAKLMQLDVRENLEMRDGFFLNEERNRLSIIKKIRQYAPEIIITNAIDDRHPDHGRACKLVHDSVFLSGLVKIETEYKSTNQSPWRPRLILSLIQDKYIQPDILIDISDVWEEKKAAIAAYKTQFYTPEYAMRESEAETYISSPQFMKSVEARARDLGKYISCEFAEGFTSGRLLGVNNLFNLL